MLAHPCSQNVTCPAVSFLVVRVFVGFSRWKLLKVTVVSSYRGNSPSQAEISFLNKCKWLELYGVDMHFVKVRALFFFKKKRTQKFQRASEGVRKLKGGFPFRAEMEENTPWVSLPPASWCLRAPTKSASSFGENSRFSYNIIKQASKEGPHWLRRAS